MSAVRFVTPPSIPRTKRRKHPEQDFQIALCKVLDYALPKDAVYFAVSNGFKRTKAEAGIAKAMGQKAGVPDLIFVFGSTMFAMECKAPGGSLNDAQINMIVLLSKAGVPTYVVTTIDEALAAVKAWGIPLRASVGRAAA